MATIIANKQTEIAVTISNGPITGPVWKIDGNVVQSNSNPLIIPANMFVAGTTHNVSFSGTNSCGQNTRTETLTVTDGSTPGNGILSISSIPTHADIGIDGSHDNTGYTPGNFTLSIGQHAIDLILEGYYTLYDNINIIENQTLTKNYTLIPIGDCPTPSCGVMVTQI